MRRLLSFLAAGMIVAACTGSGGGGSSSSPGASATPKIYDVATGSGDLILKMETGGGMVPVEYELTQMPYFALYGDGRIIVAGPQTEIYPAPLVPNLRVMQVSPAEIQKIVAAADDAGLLGPDANFNANDIFDASTTTFTTIVAGKTHTINAYALGYNATADDPAIEAVRARLTDFDAQIGAFSKFLGHPITDEAYWPTGMRVFATVADESTDTSGVERQVVDWPLGTDPATAGQPISNQSYRCQVLTGADMERFLVVARTANRLTIWKAPSGRYTVVVRPLYPDESGC